MFRIFGLNRAGKVALIYPLTRPGREPNLADGKKWTRGEPNGVCHMTRQLLVPTLLALLLAPDWAAAFDPCVCPPPVVVTHCPPVIVHAPLLNCTPTLGTVAPPQKGPTIVPERTEPKKPEVTADPPKTMPVKAEEPAPAKPAPLPPVKFEEPKAVEPAPIKPVAVEPKQEPKLVVPPTDRIPSPAVPPAPPKTLTKPDLGKMEFDIPPIGDVPQAKPQPAEGTKSPELPKPAAVAPQPPEKLKEFNFDLPKVDGGLAQPVEANKKTVVNSSPLADQPVVDVYVRDGKDVVTAKRGVTFVNKSARDILLTVDGQTTTLASKTVLTVELPAAFKWQIGGDPERSEKVPDGSPGVDVVIRK